MLRCSLNDSLAAIFCTAYFSYSSKPKDCRPTKRILNFCGIFRLAKARNRFFIVSKPCILLSSITGRQETLNLTINCAASCKLLLRDTVTKLLLVQKSFTGSDAKCLTSGSAPRDLSKRVEISLRGTQLR